MLSDLYGSSLGKCFSEIKKETRFSPPSVWLLFFLPLFSEVQGRAIVSLRAAAKGTATLAVECSRAVVPELGWVYDFLRDLFVQAVRICEFCYID